MMGYDRNLAADRSWLSLSQKDLAARAGVRAPLISAIECGRRRATLPVRRKLHAALEARRLELAGKVVTHAA
jgi:predicted transcriptional regulator